MLCKLGALTDQKSRRLSEICISFLSYSTYWSEGTMISSHQQVFVLPPNASTARVEIPWLMERKALPLKGHFLLLVVVSFHESMKLLKEKLDLFPVKHWRGKKWMAVYCGCSLNSMGISSNWIFPNSIVCEIPTDLAFCYHSLKWGSWVLVWRDVMWPPSTILGDLEKYFGNIKKFFYHCPSVLCKIT